MASTSFINPSKLSFSTSTSFTPASPASSASPSQFFEDDDHDDIDPGHVAGPARKRSRTSGKDESPSATLSVSEQRKEARAHRNRIAAQNSRDRRKAQFSYLERRVADLEEENRRLRAGVIVPAIANVLATPPPTVTTATLSSAVEDHLRAEREKERERENEELKERIKTLERGWDAVVKALAAQGVAAGLMNQPQVTSTPTTTTTQTPPAKLEVPSQPTFAAFPSPAPSHSSLDFESSLPPSSSLSLSSSPITGFLPMVPSAVVAPTGGDHRGTFIGSLGVPAAGGLRCGASAVGDINTNNSISATAAAVYSGAAVEGAAATADDNDQAMEALFREILASPRAAHSVVPGQGPIGVAQVTPADGAVSLSEEEEGKEGQGQGEDCVDANVNADENNNNHNVAEWANEIEMQRMLDSMIMDIQIQGEDGNGDLGGLLGLEVGMDMNLMDLGLVSAYDAGVVGDYSSRVPWEINGASVF